MSEPLFRATIHDADALFPVTHLPELDCLKLLDGLKFLELSKIYGVTCPPSVAIG